MKYRSVFLKNENVENVGVYLKNGTESIAWIKYQASALSNNSIVSL